MFHLSAAFLSGIKLTVQCQSGRAGRGAGVVCGHAGVLALVLRVNPGDLQLTAVVELRHPEEVRLLDLLLLVEPADLHIWTEDRGKEDLTVKSSHSD